MQKFANVWALVAFLPVLIPLTGVSSQTCDEIPDHFQYVSGTADYYAIVIDSTCTGCPVEVCDELGVFDGDLCVGATVYQGQWPVAVSAWADDAQTVEKDGYDGGNIMSFRIWKHSDAIEMSQLDVHLERGDGTFGDGPYAKLWLCSSCDCSNFCDANDDHVINAVDVVLVVNHVYKNMDPLPPVAGCVGENGDWNCDGLVNAVDVVHYVNYVYKSLDVLSCDPCNCDPYPTACPPYP